MELFMAQPPKKHVIDIADETPVELNIDPTLVEFLILKAGAFDAKVPPVEPDPGSNASDDEGRGILEDYASDQTDTELRDALEGLSDDEAIDLVALFWVGRGDFSRAEWAAARAQAAERTGAPVADFLLDKPQLGEFLAEGMNLLGYTPADGGVS